MFVGLFFEQVGDGVVIDYGYAFSYYDLDYFNNVVEVFFVEVFADGYAVLFVEEEAFLIVDV